ncbi:MAG: hypothetical protein KGK07_17190 [Chloroflexota bacterium]|nr:hypothetical protein [Chloroflexota bacterium]
MPDDGRPIEPVDEPERPFDRRPELERYLATSARYVLRQGLTPARLRELIEEVLSE